MAVVDPVADPAVTTSPVESYNEWDPLEEVIVGTLGGCAVPACETAVAAVVPHRQKDFFERNAGGAFPAEYTARAAAELEEFAALLTSLGVRVVRPDALDQRRPFATPDWSSPGGLYSAMPRDVLLIVGDTVIESPMAWRSRYFEAHAYRRLLMDYFRRGAKWISAPRPRLLDSLYDEDFDDERPYRSGRYATTEAEPTFDAADFIRCGRDLFAQRSHVTNLAGIEWVRRHLGDSYRVHLVEVADHAPMHIDATFMPLAPGKLLLNPERVKTVPSCFDSWDIRFAPQPALPEDHVLYMSSAWVSMNVFMVDERRVVVEAGEAPLIDFLQDWGFDVLQVSFRNVIRFGGCFHCVTADVRRRGELRSYF
ncbi:amidinotransferase [Streptomyces syringium]|uniref:amidinotransferase n=1 Tax=Streptomyces syringium TaxID=76729 RepID=UPI003D92C26D